MKQQHLFIVIAVILLCIVTGWLYFSSDDSSVANKQLDLTKVDFSLGNNDRMNEVPLRESFDLSDAQKTAISTAVNGITKIEDKLEAATLLSDICSAKPPNKFSGYRALQSGASFKFEKVGADADNTWILHGINNKVVSVNTVTKSLTMAVKNTTDPNQLFVRTTVVAPANIMDGSALPSAQTYYYFVPKAATLSGYALQYEHEQLSIRPIIQTGSGSSASTSVYKGQVFIAFASASDAELEANALDVGQAVGISTEDLQPGINQIYRDFIPATTSASGATPQSTLAPGAGSDLNALTKSQVQSVIDSLLPSLKTYFSTPNPSESNPFAGGSTGELTINVNLDDNEKFQDLSGPTNIAQSSTRALLESYLKKQKLELGGIPAVGETLTQQANGSVTELLGRIKSCPTFDRSKYITERQLSQCSGCTPDPYLRGQL